MEGRLRQIIADVTAGTAAQQLIAAQPRPDCGRLAGGSEPFEGPSWPGSAAPYPDGPALALARWSLRMSRRVGILVGLVAVVGVGGGWVAFGAALRRGTSRPIIWRRRASSAATSTGRVTATGTLSALVTVQVGSQVSGRIAELVRRLRPAGEEGAGDRPARPAAVSGGGGAGARQPRRGGGRRWRRRRAKAENAEKQLARAEELAEKNLIAARRAATPPSCRPSRRAAAVDAAARRPRAGARHLPPGARSTSATRRSSRPSTAWSSRATSTSARRWRRRCRRRRCSRSPRTSGKMQVHAAVSRGRRRAAGARDAGHVRRRRLPRRAVQGRDPADPRRAADAAERRHLRRGHRRRQPRPPAQARA